MAKNAEELSYSSDSRPDCRVTAAAELRRELELWQNREVVLQLIARRLCEAARHRSEALDRVLEQTSARLQGHQDINDLSALVPPLTRAIEALDRLPERRGGGSEKAAEDSLALVRDCLLSLLEQLPFPAEFMTQLGQLRDAISRAESAERLTAAVAEVGALISRRQEELQNQAGRFRSLLGKVTNRLDEVFHHFVEEDEAHAAGAANSRQLNDSLQREIRDLGQCSRQADDLPTLQRDVESRLSRIDQHVTTFRQRERRLESDYQVRSSQMQQRIRQLEQSSKALESEMQEYQQRALVDALSGVPNRNAYVDQGPQLIRRCREQRKPLCLVLWDIDHFKSVNDRFGHKAGDRAIKMVARQIASALRPSDFFARIGGEEFVGLLEGRDAKAALGQLNNIREALASMPFRHGDQPIRITVSCGVTEILVGDTLESAFDRADNALYQSKRGGRNRCTAAQDSPAGRG